MLKIRWSGWTTTLDHLVFAVDLHTCIILCHISPTVTGGSKERVMESRLYNFGNKQNRMTKYFVYGAHIHVAPFSLYLRGR